MPIHLPQNQYRGVNAHLHSYCQFAHEWTMVHAEFIPAIRLAVQSQLPSESGYFVLSERSLQLVREEDETGDVDIIKNRQDVGIYRGAGNTDTAIQAALPEGLALAQTLLPEPEVDSLMIYKAYSGMEGKGKPITRIELLSPANKPPGSHALNYLLNRTLTLRSRINMVEIDLLHERRHPIPTAPDYPKREARATPYIITVSHPYPDADTGRIYYYPFRVDDAIPPVHIPWEDSDVITVDFDAAYQQMYNTNYAFGRLIVDYAELPANFATYADEDQRRIQTRMQHIADTMRQS